MNMAELTDTARSLVAGDKGLLALDESNPTCNKRFAALGILQTVDVRRAYREMLVTTPGLGECISGVILSDETIRQQDEANDRLRAHRDRLVEAVKPFAELADLQPERRDTETYAIWHTRMTDLRRARSALDAIQGET